jgi:hypothetical protein
MGVDCACCAPVRKIPEISSLWQDQDLDAVWSSG